MEDKKKKTMQIAPDKTFSTMMRLVYKEGGKVPEAWSGLYSSRKTAKVAIEEYERYIAMKKQYPRAPQEPAPKEVAEKKTAPKSKPEEKRSVESNGEAKDTGRVQ